MEAFTAFFSMGGYAAYVWPAFGIAFAILLILLVSSLRTLRRREKLLGSLQAAVDQGGTHSGVQSGEKS